MSRTCPARHGCGSSYGPGGAATGGAGGGGVGAGGGDGTGHESPTHLSTALNALGYCVDARAHPSAPFPGAGARSHQEARRLFRAVPGACELPVRCLAAHRPRSPGALGRLVSDAREASAADALHTVREEGRGGRGSGEAQASRCAQEPSLAVPTAVADRPLTAPGLQRPWGSCPPSDDSLLRFGRGCRFDGVERLPTGDERTVALPDHRHRFA